MERLSRGFGLGKPSWRADLGVVKAVLIARLKIISRYKGSLLMDTFMPVVFAAMPIILGVSVAGANAGGNFAERTGTSNYKMYMLVGSCTFMVVSVMLWLVGYWLRREQETGTLESVFLAPAGQIYVLSGVTLYALIRTIAAFGSALVIGSLLFQVNPLDGNLAAAMGFLAIGLIPLWGLSMLFGALILRIKEANSVIQLMTWVVSFLMGIFFPLAFFPPLLRGIALLFPPTVMNDAMRASLLNLETFFGSWYASLAVMLAFAFAIPLLGYEMFAHTGRRVRAREGVGQY